MGTYRDLTVYKKGFDLAMEIFNTSSTFPPHEKYSLCDQIRRSSRSICVNLAEGYRKRRYPAHFISKVTDADMENTETQVWLEFATACGYITAETYESILGKSDEVGRMLNHMIENPDRYFNNTKSDR